MRKTDTIKPWPTRRKSTEKIRADPNFVRLIETLYPNARNPERTRRVMDELLNGKKK